MTGCTETCLSCVFVVVIYRIDSLNELQVWWLFEATIFKFAFPRRGVLFTAGVLYTAQLPCQILKLPGASANFVPRFSLISLQHPPLSLYY